MCHEYVVYMVFAMSVVGCSSSPTGPAPAGSSIDASASDAASDAASAFDAAAVDGGADGATCVAAVCITLPESGGRCASGENMAACATDRGEPCAPDPSCTRAANQTGGDSRYFCCVD